MKTKLSQYNFEVEHTEHMLLYNALTHKLLPVTYPEYAAIETLMEHLPEFEQLYPELYNAFKNAGFIVNEDFDELAYIKLQSNRKIYGNRNYHITINPTLDCNVRCWYCSVDYAGTQHDRGRMSEETIEALKEHIHSLMRNKGTDSVMLDWFGGEPTMYYEEVMKPISEFATRTARELGVDFSQRITTNGTLLNEERLREMRDQNFTFFQISTDGNESRHNKIKFFADKSGTYRKVFENIKLITEILPDATVMLRINYDKQTLKDVTEIIGDLSETNKKNIVVDFERVWQVQLTEKEHQLLAGAKESFKAASLYAGSWAYRPRSFQRCYADTMTHYVINYNGKIFKCTARDYGDDMLLGTLQPSGKVEWNDELISHYFEKATFENEMCEACKILPLCMGPCIQKVYESKKKKTRLECILQNPEYDMSAYIIDTAKTRNLI